jgi:hypothetical protein
MNTVQKVAVSIGFSVLVATSSLPAAAPGAQPPLRAGSVYRCQLSDEARLVFDGKTFVGGVAKEGASLQIRILREELEMTLASTTGEIYTEKDLILGRSEDARSLFAIYRAPAGNIVSLAMHALKGGGTIFTQSKTYQLGTSVYQAISSGHCRQL